MSERRDSLVVIIASELFVSLVNPCLSAPNIPCFFHLLVTSDDCDWEYTQPADLGCWEESPSGIFPPAWKQPDPHSSSQTPECGWHSLPSATSPKLWWPSSAAQYEECILGIFKMMIWVSLLCWKSTAAEARVAWPHRFTSVAGVNHRRPNREPAITAHKGFNNNFKYQIPIQYQYWPVAKLSEGLSVVIKAVADRFISAAIFWYRSSVSFCWRVKERKDILARHMDTYMQKRADLSLECTEYDLFGYVSAF